MVCHSGRRGSGSRFDLSRSPSSSQCTYMLFAMICLRLMPMFSLAKSLYFCIDCHLSDRDHMKRKDVMSILGLVVVP